LQAWPADPDGGAKKKVILKGAGIAGLSCAYELVRRGHQVTVLEATGRPGGHVRTFHYPGYTEYWRYLQEFSLTAVPYPRGEVGFAEQVKGDPIFQGSTIRQAIEWSRSRGVGQTWQDYFHINHVPDIGSLQPESCRIGGDHDRGFSPALNQVMREKRDDNLSGE
jgi:hypothetical protein